MLIFGLTASCIKVWKWEKSCIKSQIIAINDKGKAKIHHPNKKKCFVVSLWLLPMVSILANFGDFRDFRDFRLSDTSFLIENGLFFLIREIPKFFSNLFYTQSTPRFQSTIRNFQNQPCMTPPEVGHARMEKWENAYFRPCPPVRNWWPCIRPCSLTCKGNEI